MEAERPLILTESHEGIVGGHYTGKKTTQKVFRDGLWWPTLHIDAKDYYRACDICQRVGKPSRRDDMPLAPQLTLQEFDKWSISQMIVRLAKVIRASHLFWKVSQLSDIHRRPYSTP